MQNKNVDFKDSVGRERQSYDDFCRSAIVSIISGWSRRQANKKTTDKLLNTVSIDYSNPEIIDIQEAVAEILTRYKDTINNRGKFHITRIQSGGSMREKTSVWKHGLFKFHSGELQVFTEFDYLAFLKKSCRYGIFINERNCCATVKKVFSSKPCSCELTNCSRAVWPNVPGGFDKEFKEELSLSVETACDCYQMYGNDRLYRYKFRQTSSEQKQRGCDKCVVYKQTGKLQIDSTIEATFPHPGATLKLMWTSDAKTLIAFDENKVGTGEIEITPPIERLPILIDFLPAIEIHKEDRVEHGSFLVPKKCSLHPEKWRLSGSNKETYHFVNEMSQEHRKCYKILKFIGCGIPGYHLKTAALNHSVTCTDVHSDYRNCVMAVLVALKMAYERKYLESFSFKFNILEEYTSD